MKSICGVLIIIIIFCFLLAGLVVSIMERRLILNRFGLVMDETQVPDLKILMDFGHS